MRIAALVPEGILNSIYRSLVPMQALAHRGHSIHVEERDHVRDAAPLLEYDVVHFLRLCHQEMLHLARRLSDAGVAIVWDNDDDLLRTPKGNPSYRERTGLVRREIARLLTAMTTLADVVTTPSPVLAESYREMSGCDARVLGNYLPPTFTHPGRLSSPGQITIGWVAAMEHHRDIEQLRLREVFERLLTKHPGVSVVTVGVNLGLPRDRYRHIEGLVYGALPEAIADFDVAIAPLTDIPFNRARSDVKLKEYAAIGVPWLASSIGPYSDMGEDQGGRLVTDDGWDEALSTFVDDRTERIRLGRQGLRWARTQTIEHHVDRWEQTLEDAVTHAKAIARSAS
ncbi:MAG TPA: glycosyltransferase [Conexibacter sp.]|jgi:glycosyltransferase involved in cell wall biosynthesis|nr:glycosyltransferase [Conexibacter sp.]